MTVMGNSFRDGEDGKEEDRENAAGDGGFGLGEKVDDGDAEKNEGDETEAERNLKAENAEIERDTIFAVARMGVAKNENSHALQSETPNDAEGIKIREEGDVAAADDDGEDLKSRDDVDDAVGRSVKTVRLTEPGTENTILRNAVQNAVGANDRGVDSASEDQSAHNDNKAMEDQAEDERSLEVHGEAADKVLEEILALLIGDDHHREERNERGEDQAIDEDDQAGLLEVRELRMLDFAVDLGQGFFAAHGEDRVAEAYKDGNEPGEVCEMHAVEPAHGVGFEFQVPGVGEGGQSRVADEDGIDAPSDKDDDHDGGNLHDPHGFLAGLVDAFDVVPPEIDGAEDGETGGAQIGTDVKAEVNEVGGLVEKADDVLPGRDAADGAGQDVVEHEGRNAELGERAAHGLFDDAVNAATDEHAATFDVDRAD